MVVHPRKVDDLEVIESNEDDEEDHDYDFTGDSDDDGRWRSESCSSKIVNCDRTSFFKL